MYANNPPRSVKAWHDRMRGRAAFAPAIAEAAIRQAYRSCGMSAPARILWAKGPDDAARLIAFLNNPPKRLRRRVAGLCALGVVGWIGLTYGVSTGGFSAPGAWAAAISAVILAGLGVLLAVGQTLPPPPSDAPVSGPPGPYVLSALTFFASACYAFALQDYGAVVLGSSERGAAYILSAFIGLLPGMLLNSRVRRTYALVSAELRNIRPSPSVAARFRRNQNEIWNLPERPPARVRPLPSLLQLYRAAHLEGYARQAARQPRFESFVGLREGVIGERFDASIPALYRDLRSQPFFEIPGYWDGMDEAERAAAVDGAAPNPAAAVFTNLAFHVDRLYPFEEIAVAVKPPVKVMLDGEGRPHAEGEPALAWSDGVWIHAWHGRRVPAHLVDRARLVTPSRINRESDPEWRWVLIERYGLGRYLLECGASEVQRDACGRLYRLPSLGGDPLMAVRVTNHTPEPDGTVREFWLRVPPTMATARQAVAWTFGLSVEEYGPLLQS